jgi:hypothetical protein
VRKRGFLTKAFCEHKTIVLCWTLQHLAPCAQLQNTRGNTIVDEPLQLQLHGGVCSLHFRIRVCLWLKSQKLFFAMNLHLLVLNQKIHSLPRICTCLLSPAQTHYPESAIGRQFSLQDQDILATKLTKTFLCRESALAHPQSQIPFFAKNLHLPVVTCTNLEH